MLSRIFRWGRTGLLYGLGVLFWWVFFAYADFNCYFSSHSFINSLWTKRLNEDLVLNIAGDIAYRAIDGYGDYGCGDKYIYVVKYVHHDGTEEYKSLRSLVDPATWRYEGLEGITSTIVDSKHRYTVRSTSDGIEMTAEDL